jgi:hypothetical protein
VEMAIMSAEAAEGARLLDETSFEESSGRLR